MAVWVVLGEIVDWLVLRDLSFCSTVWMTCVAHDFELEAWCSEDGVTVWIVFGVWGVFGWKLSV